MRLIACIATSALQFELLLLWTCLSIYKHLALGMRTPWPSSQMVLCRYCMCANMIIQQLLWNWCMRGNNTLCKLRVCVYQWMPALRAKHAVKSLIRTMRIWWHPVHMPGGHREQEMYTQDNCEVSLWVICYSRSPRRFICFGHSPSLTVPHSVDVDADAVLFYPLALTASDCCVESVCVEGISVPGFVGRATSWQILHDGRGCCDQTSAALAGCWYGNNDRSDARCVTARPLSQSSL